MPQRISIVYICSLCASETDDPDKVTGYQLSGPRKLALNYDVCTDCAEVGPFHDFLDKGLRDTTKVVAPKRTAPMEAAATGAFPCRSCGHPYGAPQGRAAHERWCGKTEEEIAAEKARIAASRAANAR